LQIANILKSSFGDKILTILPNIKLKTFPTLDSTLGKIIIKNAGNFIQYQLVVEVGASNTASIDNEGSSSEEEPK
jgi:hypothetical protein